MRKTKYYGLASVDTGKPMLFKTTIDEWSYEYVICNHGTGWFGLRSDGVELVLNNSVDFDETVRRGIWVEFPGNPFKKQLRLSELNKHLEKLLDEE